MLRAELLKLKRSSTWLIALILPLLAVTTGTINLADNSDTLSAGWASFTSQVVLFYGLLFFSIGIGLLAAAGSATAPGSRIPDSSNMITSASPPSQGHPTTPGVPHTSLTERALTGSGGRTLGDALPILLTAVVLAAVFVCLTLGAIRVIKLR